MLLERLLDSNISIAVMAPDEDLQVAHLHMDGIPLGFINSFGDRFVGRMYRGIATAPESGVWVARSEQGNVLGFVAGTTCVARCYRHVLLKQGLVMSLLAVPTLIRPSVWRHVFETLSYPFKRPDSRDTESQGSNGTDVPAELLAIAVDSTTRGLGLGSRLVSQLEHAFHGWRYQEAYRVGTHAADPRSNAFYEKVGFNLASSFTHHEHTMNRYLKHQTDAVSHEAK